jgi:hypothetical protein
MRDPTRENRTGEKSGRFGRDDGEEGGGEGGEVFFRKNWENGISFLTLGKCGLISNFGVNFPRMSASSELEPHPSCPRVRSSQLTAFPASEVCCAGAEVRAGRASRGGFTDG